MTDSTVLYEEQGVVALLTLNRPAALNAFTREMHHDLWAALDRAEANAAIRAVVLTGAGRGFCAGADLNAGDLGPKDSPTGDGCPPRSTAARVAAPPKGAASPWGGPAARPDPGVSIEQAFNPTARRLQNLRMPTVVAVNGVAAGAGMSFVLACDIAIAAPGASFIQAFSKIGLVPDAGSTWFLPQRLGMPRALALAMTGDKLMAAQAKDWGLIWDVADDCLAASLTLAQRLAAMPTQALVATRHLLRDACSRPLNQQLDAERDAQSAMGKTHDYVEGVLAFREKRQPRFTGN